MLDKFRSWDKLSGLHSLKMSVSGLPQWLRLHASSAGGKVSIPGQGTKISCAM